jgi:hypothetical protein
MITFAEGANDDKSGFSVCSRFRNPRLIGNKPKGFSKELMFELQESIRTEGLHHPPKLRWVNDDSGERKLQLIAGERRTRCLKKLIKEKTECFDPTSGKYVNAADLYDEIDAYVLEMDDQAAFKHAFSSNDRAVGIGECATVNLVREFRQLGYTDGEILSITGKSITWLKETDDLINVDGKIFDALVADQINRSVAIHLSKEPVADRMALLDVAHNFANARLSNVKKKLQIEVDAADHKADMAKAKSVVAEHRGDEAGKKEADAKVDKLQAKASSKRKEKESIESDAGKVTGKDLQKAKNAKQKEAGGDDEKVALTKSKIKKFWYDVAVSLIKSEGCDENGEPLEIDLEDVRLGKLFCEAIEKGETDFTKILKHHQKQKEKRAG